MCVLAAVLNKTSLLLFKSHTHTLHESHNNASYSWINIIFSKLMKYLYFFINKTLSAL